MISRLYDLSLVVLFLSLFIDHQAKVNNEFSAALAEIPLIHQRITNYETELVKLKEQVASLSRDTSVRSTVDQKVTYVTDLILAGILNEVIDPPLSVCHSIFVSLGVENLLGDVLGVRNLPRRSDPRSGY